MRRLVLTFLMTALLGLCVIPVHNLLQPGVGSVSTWTMKSVFNMDWVDYLTNAAIYRLGISTQADQVVIGREGWLYLGDRHDQTLSVSRRGQTPESALALQGVGNAAQAWEHWLKLQGVKAYRLMVGPNKGSIYPEYMPDWARPREPSPLDGLTTGETAGLFIDLKAPLLLAKGGGQSPLYYLSDTHWNALGAALAFKAFAQAAAISLPEVRWPESAAYAVASRTPRGGGDLARFLRLHGLMSDAEIGINVHNIDSGTALSDFDDGSSLAVEELTAKVARPVLAQSARALNKARVLWLRDSFGDALAPFMAATFSDVIMIHWNEAMKPGGRFADLVEKWHPDYVFVTVVERALLSPLLRSPPPLVPRGAGTPFVGISVGQQHHAHSIIRDDVAGRYLVQGPDANVDFAMSFPRRPLEAPLFKADIACDDGLAKIPVQIFWLKEGRPEFEEANSVVVNLTPGVNVVDMRLVPGWRGDEKITRLRFDVDPPGSSCARFRLQPPELGTR